MGYNRAKKKMKKILRLSLMAALILMVCLPSCKKNETQISGNGTQVSDNKEKIVGKWVISYAEFDGYDDEYVIGDHWKFKEEGKFIGNLAFGKKKSNSKYDDIECNWRINGNKLVLEGGDLDDSDSGYDDEGYYSWESNWVFTLNIKQLDESNLVVSGTAKVDWKETEDGETEHGTETYNVKYELEK